MYPCHRKASALDAAGLETSGPQPRTDAWPDAVLAFGARFCFSRRADASFSRTESEPKRPVPGAITTGASRTRHRLARLRLRSASHLLQQALHLVHHACYPPHRQVRLTQARCCSCTTSPPICYKDVCCGAYCLKASSAADLWIRCCGSTYHSLRTCQLRLSNDTSR